MTVGVYLPIRYNHFMKRLGKHGWWLLCGLACVPVLRADDKLASDNPYSGIVARNVFGLVPPPPPPPPEAPPVDPPPKITPNGIMNVFGNLEVLFKVAPINKPGQPPGKEESYTMAVGDDQDDIKVIKIDDKAETITFDNHGTTQEIPLATAPTLSGPAAAPGAPAAPGMPVPGGVFQGRIRSRFPGGPAPLPGSDPNPVNPQASANPGLGTGFGGGFGGGVAPSAQKDPNVLTPEAQVIMMEKQRADFEAAGNPAAMLLPPTPLTQLLHQQQPPENP